MKMKTKTLMLCALVAMTACGSETKTKTETQPEPAATPVQMSAKIELKTPPKQDGLSINEALWNRRSTREYSAQPLSLEELSGVMWAAAGINREDGHLTAPSTRGMYPLRVYAFFPEGVYMYDAKANTLNHVVNGDYRELTAMQDFAYTAPLNLVYVADFSVYSDQGNTPDPMKMRVWAMADAAGYAENVNLYTAGHDMKSITRGSFKGKALMQLLGLDPARYDVILVQTVGK